MNREKTLRLARLAGWSLIALILLFFAFLALLQTRGVKTMIALKLSDSLSSEPNRHVSIVGLSGLIPLAVHIDALKISDPEGVWLSADNVWLRWSPLELFTRHLKVEELSASELKLYRLPEKEKEEEPARLSSIFQKLPRLTIEKLSMENLYLAKAALGEEANFKIDGSLVPDRVGPGTKVFLSAERKDEGTQERADIRVTEHGTAPSFEVGAEVHEGADGILAKAFGLKDLGPLSFTLKGDGPKGDWKGALEAKTSGLGFVRAGIGFKAGLEQTVSVEGSYEPSGGLISQKLCALLENRNEFGFNLSYAPSKALLIKNGAFSGAGYRLELAGSLDLKTLELESNASLEVDDLKVLEDLSAIPLSGKLLGRVAVSGPLERPKAALSLELKGAQLRDIKAEDFKADLALEETEEAGRSSFSAFEIKGSGSADGLAALDGPALPESSIKWKAEAKIPRKGNILIPSLVIEGKKNLLGLSGYIDPLNLSATLDATLDAKDLADLAKTFGKEIPGGAASLKAHVEADAKKGSAAGRLEGRLTGLDAFSSRFSPVFGPGLDFDGRFELEQKTRLEIPSLSLKNPLFSLETQGQVDFLDKKLSGKWRLSAPKLDPLKAVIGKPVSGSLEAEGELSGPFNALESRSSLKGSSVVFDRVEFKQLLSTINIRDVSKSPKGEIKVEASRAGQKLDASSNFALKDRQLTLSKLSLTTPGGKLNGAVTVDLKSYRADGNLEGGFSELKSFGQIVGEPVGGSAKFEARFKAGKAGQYIKMNLHGAQLATGWGNVESLSLSADIENVAAAPKGKAELDLAGFKRGGLSVESLKTKALGTGKEVSFEGSAKGRSIRDFEIRTKGVLTRSGKTGTLRINTLGGRLGNYPLSLVQPLLLERTAKGFSLQKSVISLGEGRVELTGSSSARNIDFTGDFKNFHLEALSALGGADIRGKLSGRASLEGDISKPSGSFQVRLIPPENTHGAQGGLDVTLEASGKLENGSVRTGFELKGLSGKPTSGSFKMPLVFSLAPLRAWVPQKGPIEGHLESKSDLTTLSLLFPIEGQRLSGDLSAAVDLSGTVEAPVVSGKAGITNGSYENFTNGTVLKDLSAVVTARGRRVEIESLQATDGKKGTIEAAGWVEVDKERNFPLELDGRVSRAILVRRADLNATISGPFKLTGSSKEATLSGDLKADSAEAVLIKSRPPALAELQVVEINAPGEKGEKEKEKKPEESASPSEPAKVKLDINLKFGERSMARGRGLNSEWKGNLKVTGTSAMPLIVGELTLVRGDYDFLGKQFKLVDGTIRFEGQTPPVPSLNINAEAKTTNLTARLSITGPASAPKIALESDPALPSDEILSRLLFNRSPTELSPVQGLQLANAARALSGRGNALDFMERMRETLGLEQLQLLGSEGTKGGVSVGIGKHLTQGIYLDIEKGVGDQTGKAAAQIDITPNLRLQSEGGIGARQGMELDWKYDY